jgi:nucleoside-diphosphate-sugar epimerase
MFLGSSCIYPKLAPQPLREDSMLTGMLEPTNEPYAIAKIAASRWWRPIANNMAPTSSA